MKSVNPVFQVLVTSGNQAILAAGSRVDSLKSGQIGLFNYHTGLSIDGTSQTDYQEFFIAVGVNRGITALPGIDDINKSTGQLIQRTGQKYYTLKPTMDEVAKIVDVTNFTVMCEMEYGINIEFRNQKSYALNGYSQFRKYFSAYSGCCPSTACDDCDRVGDPTVVVNSLITQINQDPDHLVTASAVAQKIGGTITAGASATGNTTVTIGSTSYTVPVTTGDSTSVVAGKIAAQVNSQAGSPYRANANAAVLSIYPTSNADATGQTFAVSGSGVTGTGTPATKTTSTDTTGLPAGASAGLRITGVVQPRDPFNGFIPIKYSKAGLDFIVSFGTNGGLTYCNGTITTIQNAQYPEGKGYDLQALEYEAGGWNGKPGPYRQRAVTGLQKENFEYFAQTGSSYTQVVLGGEQVSESGARDYQADNVTIVAIPSTDSATLTSFTGALDTILAARFGAMANDITALIGTGSGGANMGVSAVNDYTKDGIESLS
jgi:hypothetical protein